MPDKKPLPEPNPPSQDLPIPIPKPTKTDTSEHRDFILPPSTPQTPMPKPPKE